MLYPLKADLRLALNMQHYQLLLLIVFSYERKDGLLMK